MLFRSPSLMFEAEPLKLGGYVLLLFRPGLEAEVVVGQYADCHVEVPLSGVIPEVARRARPERGAGTSVQLQDVAESSQRCVAKVASDVARIVRESREDYAPK